MGPSSRFIHVMIYWTVWDWFIQVLYLGRAPCTKETLPNFREKCWVTRHLRVFRGLTGSQRTPGFWGVTSSFVLKEGIMENISSQGDDHFKEDEMTIMGEVMDKAPLLRQISSFKALE